MSEFDNYLEAKEDAPKGWDITSIKDAIFSTLGTMPEENGTMEGAEVNFNKPPEKETSAPSLDVGVIMDKVLEETENPPEEIYEVEGDEDAPSEEKAEPTPEAPPSRFNFSETELKQVAHALMKKNSGYKKVYRLNNDYAVVVRPSSDLENSALNMYFGWVTTQGDKRVRVTTIDPYEDNKTKQTVPGGRTEEVYYVNPDNSRAMARATMAIYLESIGDTVFSKVKKEDPLGSLEKKVNEVEEFSPHLLDVINDKVIIPFIELLNRATEKLNVF